MKLKYTILAAKKICATVLLAVFSAGYAAAEIKSTEKSNRESIQKMKDLKKLHENCSLLLQKQYMDIEKAQKSLASQNKDGSWSDIDYYSKNYAAWDPSKHLYNLRFMAAAWRNPESPLHHSKKLGDSIKLGLEFWLKEKRTALNWWWNEIFVPMTLGHIFILSDDLLQDGQWLDKFLPYFNQAKLGYTGQNRIWVSEGVLFKAILLGDEKLISAAAKEILAEISYSKNGEGIRVDGAFHQHGKQLQFGNYGLSFLNDISALIAFFSGTKWELSQIVPFRDFVINGIKWVLWNDVMDISAQGRQIKMDTQTEKKRTIRKAIELLAAQDPSFTDKYREEPIGNRMFFTSDFMVHRTGNFYASYRANSVNVCPVETYVNNDNLLGRYLSDGLLMVMRSGKEYLNIAGCWEWNRLPGTTLPAVPLVETGNNNDPKAVIFPRRTIGESTFTGGVSDGKNYGAMIYSMNLDKVKAQKAVFFAGNIIIALGSGINSDSPYPVATTVEQSLLNGEVFKGENYFYHNNIGYSGKNIVLSTCRRKGNWKLTSGGYKTSVPDEKDIFQLTIDHGKNVRNGSYEYAIYPDTALKDMSDAIKSYQVSANDENVQAVKLKDNTIMAVFHKGGSLGSFTTDSAGVFIIKDDMIYAADPTHEKRIFNLAIDKKQYKIELPSGDFAGSTAAVKR